jgi:predicted transposase YbfD/YdcC
VRTKLPLRLDQDWPGITAICRIERIRELKDRCSSEVIYAITSLAADKLDPARLLQLSRDHWAIENSLFHVRDVTFREDACRVRTGSAPQALAAIRDGVLNYIRKPARSPDQPEKPSPRASGRPSASSGGYELNCPEARPPVAQGRHGPRSRAKLRAHGFEWWTLSWPVGAGPR